MEKVALIIDDDHAYLKFMQGHFNLLEGFTTEICPTGEAAMKKLPSLKPYLIILDHQLTDPDKDGFFFLKKIKKHDSKIPVICITGDTSVSLKERVKRLRVQGFIYKNEAFLVNLRTALDHIHEKSKKKKSIFKQLFK